MIIMLTGNPCDSYYYSKISRPVARPGLITQPSPLTTCKGYSVFETEGWMYIERSSRLYLLNAIGRIVNVLKQKSPGQIDRGFYID